MVIHNPILTGSFTVNNIDVSNEDAKVQAIANAIWTAEVIAAYQASQTGSL